MNAWNKLKAASSLLLGSAWDLLSQPYTSNGTGRNENIALQKLTGQDNKQNNIGVVGKLRQQQKLTSVNLNQINGRSSLEPYIYVLRGVNVIQVNGKGVRTHVPSFDYIAMANTPEITSMYNHQLQSTRDEELFDGPRTYDGPYPVAEHYIVDFPITKEVIEILLPETYYTTVEPFVLAMVNGGPTNVTVQPMTEVVEKLGIVYTRIRFIFPIELVGLRCNAWMTGGY